MKSLIRIEEVFLFILSIYLFSNLEFAWWWFPVLLFIPDIGMGGYLINRKIGAVVYNIVHHRAIAITFFIIGGILNSHLTQLVGVILFAHSTLDRVFDFGLKYEDDFKHTHLT